MEMVEMKLLITGANGFIGAYFMEYFSSIGHEVTGTIRNEKNARGGFRYIVGDLAEGFQTQECFDVVIHCAAELDKEPKGMEQYVRGNILAAQKLLEYARCGGTGRIINLNGVRCFGKVRDTMISEYTPIYNPGYYGLTKAIAESLLLDSDIAVISLILPGIVGRNGHTPWIMRVSRDFLANKHVDCYDPDARFNNIVHVDTLSKIVQKLLDAKINKNERILLGCRDYARKYDVLCFLKKRLNSTSDIKIINSTETSFCLDLMKAKTMQLPLPNVEEELEKLIKELLLV